MTNTHATLRINGPVDLLSAVPYLLGFHPHDSLVLIGLTHGVLVVTARLDLEDADEEAVASTIDAMVRGGSSQFVAAVYAAESAADDGLPHSSLVELVEELTMRAGAQLLDGLLVIGDLWWSYLCADQQCCPANGRALPAAPTPFAAAATVVGLTAAASRDDLECRFEPEPGREKLLPLIEEADRSLQPVVVNRQLTLPARCALRAIITEIKHAGDARCRAVWDENDVIRVGAALRQIPIRDAVWEHLDEHRPHAQDIWLDLARRLPTPYDAAPLFLYAWAAWRAGDGTTASMAVERALRGDPDYAAAELLRTALVQGISPHAIPPLRSKSRG